MDIPKCLTLSLVKDFLGRNKCGSVSHAAHWPMQSWPFAVGISKALSPRLFQEKSNLQPLSPKIHNHIALAYCKKWWSPAAEPAAICSWVELCVLSVKSNSNQFIADLILLNRQKSPTIEDRSEKFHQMLRNYKEKGGGQNFPSRIRQLLPGIGQASCSDEATLGQSLYKYQHALHTQPSGSGGSWGRADRESRRKIWRDLPAQTITIHHRSWRIKDYFGPLRWPRHPWERRPINSNLQKDLITKPPPKWRHSALQLQWHSCLPLFAFWRALPSHSMG